MDDSDSQTKKRQTPRVLKVLEALKQASRDLRFHPSFPDSDDPDSSAIKALLELETGSETFLSTDPSLSALSSLLGRLKDLTHALQKSRAKYGLFPFLTRRISTRSISIVAESIETELQAWIDRQTIEGLIGELGLGLRDEKLESEDELIGLLTRFEDRVNDGFDRELQDLILKSKIFALFESVLCDSNRSERIREHCAYVIGALIQFNKDVFVGEALIGPTINVLVTMSTKCSMKVLSDLIRSIKSPIVDQLESNGEIARIAGFLNSPDLETQVLGFECALDIGYFGRKEAIDALLEEGLVEWLVGLQRSDLGGGLVVVDDQKTTTKRRENLPFERCVARFAVSLEVGEGLRKREKRSFKQQILGRVREACDSEAESSTIVAEVLWGSSP